MHDRGPQEGIQVGVARDYIDAVRYQSRNYRRHLVQHIASSLQGATRVMVTAGSCRWVLAAGSARPWCSLDSGAC